MKVTRNLLVILLSLILSVPVFAKGSHGGRSNAPHSHRSHVSKKSHAAGSHDGHYIGGQDTFHAKWMEIHPVSNIQLIP
jgi:hypothetical protein